MSTPFVEANDLWRSYKDIEAASGVSFTVPPGEIFGKLGLHHLYRERDICWCLGRIDGQWTSA